MIRAEQTGPSILIVEDDPSHAILMRASLEGICRDLTHVDTQSNAISEMSKRDYDLLLLDLGLPDGSGMAVQEWLSERAHSPAVVVVTADDLAERAVEVMRMGAANYVVKRPNYLMRLNQTVSEALQGISYVTTGLEDASESPDYGDSRAVPSLIGKSRQIRQVCSRIEKCGRHDATVLITGEMGTGKELVARAIHDSSSRISGPFVPVNCAAINGGLFESEFFGSSRGAFTGAVRDRGGLLRAAEGGTIFLDEVGELPLESQAKLLRVLEEGTYRPVGNTREVSADVRILAATNRRLQDEVESGSFRRDLYYRLDILQLHVPPLRERMVDIPLLVEHFLELESKGGRLHHATHEAVDELRLHSWPGNARELRSLIIRTLAWSSDSVIEHFDLRKNSDELSVATNRRGLGWREIAGCLTESNGRLGPASEAMQISKRTLQRRMHDLGMNIRDFR
jgi:DNA-binding NtrC family response regulator